MKFLAVLICLASCSFAQETDWRQKLDAAIPLLGHRNWIVIADSAYPAQSGEGIQTVVTNANHMEVLRAVMGALSNARHITPIIWTDKELKYVPDADAPGVSAFRDRLNSYLHDRKIQTIPHEQVISLLDKSAQSFKVLILKTTMTIPYTSIFLQLDCAYWTPEAEQRLRSAMNGK